VQFQGDGVSVYAEVDAEGHLRARVRPPELNHTPAQALSGGLFVIKSNAEIELYRGATRVDAESAESALSRYFEVSAQVDSVLRIAAHQEGEAIAFAGGVFVERLPAEEDLPSLESSVFGERFAALGQADVRTMMADIHLGSLLEGEISVLETTPLTWKCRCGQAKVLGVLASVGPQVLREILEEEGQASITCEFCQSETVVGPQELQALLASLA
jgi:molecular chaperone Hsp33